MANYHPVWTLLFFNSHFWECVGHSGFRLRQICKSFRAEIPESLAICAIFADTVCQKADLFRLLPLSITDVVHMNSSVGFLEGFDIAVRKVKGFDNCMAFVRERGWRHVGCLNKDRLDSLIDDAKFSDQMDKTNPVYLCAVKSSNSQIVRVVTWCYRCPYQWQGDYGELLHVLYGAVGYWYKGIHRDVRSVRECIYTARTGRRPFGDLVQHQLITSGVLIIGVISFFDGFQPCDSLI